MLEWGQYGENLMAAKSSDCHIAILLMSLLLPLSVAAGAVEVVIDNSDSGFTILSGTWMTGTSATPYGTDYRWRAAVAGSPTGEVEWRPSLPASGTYEVFVWYVEGANRATNAPFVIHGVGDPVTVFVNQQTNGSQWFSLGSYPFATGTGGYVRLNNVATGDVVIADAVRFVLAGDTPVNTDFDGDQDVDGSDLAIFLACITGTDVGPAAEACHWADFDGDLDVDQADFGVLQHCLSGPDVPATSGCLSSPIPPRPAGAVTGSQFVQQVWSIPKATREQMILAEMTAGNIPEFLRSFVPITVTATIASVEHTATYFVMPDYLAIGSDADFVRFPMGPLTAQSIGDAFQCMMPTRKMVNDIWSAAPCKLAPHPYSPSVYNIESVEVFNMSNTYIEGQRIAAGASLGTLIAGTKKDVVVTAQLATYPGKVAIYGWHQLNGQPIQPLYLGHTITYMDYSHGIRLVKRVMLVDGQPMLVEDVLKDPVLSVLISDEGVVNDPRYY